MVYVLIDENNHAQHVMDVNVNTMLNWDVQLEGNARIVVKDSFEIDDSHDLCDYVYDDETDEFVYTPQEEPIEYVDVKSGEKVSMTSKEFDEMVDEKVRNQVQAVLEEMVKDNTFELAYAKSIVGQAK